MESNFLRAPVLPGNQIEHHEHRLLVTILICIVVVAVILGVVYLWTSPKKEIVITPVVVDTTQKLKDEDIISRLSEYTPAQNLSTKTVSAITKKLDQAASTTETQRAAIIIRLQEI